MSSNHLNSTQQQQLDQLCEIILTEQEKTPGPHYAAFDADGTLWDTDMGENFFDFQIHKCGLKNLPDDPWKHYKETKIIDTPKAYLWLAQISQNHTLTQVRKWSEDAYLSLKPFPFLNFQKELIRFLQENEFQIYVVTASVKWAVEPGARRLGIPEENVLGIKTTVIDGVVTDKQEGPITWKQGKAEAILEATNGIKPIFCSGNTLGDAQLLGLAKVASAIRSQKPGEPLFETETELQNLAKTKNWLCYDLS